MPVIVGSPRIVDNGVEGMDDVQVLKVEKRDGRIVDFDNENIVNAVTAAYKDLDKELGAEEAQTISEVANTVRDRVIGRYAVDGRPVRIDDIQNTVITVLQQQFHLYDVARAYNDYKFARDEKRAKESDVNYAVERLLKRDKSLVNENANKDSNVFSVQRDLLSGSVEKAIARKQLPADVVRAHERGQIHFHDMDYSPFTAMTNCFGRETRFITNQGVKSFEDFNDGDEVTVLAPSGEWRHAVVHNYGQQKLYNITFVRNKMPERTVAATRNHRWLLSSGTVTTDLQEGQTLLLPPLNHYTTDSGFLIGKHNPWKVKSIAETSRTEDVWCVEVDEEHAFILDSGIVTGNCCLPNFKDMLAHGFKLGNAEMESPKSIETASTQITQIIQSVSSSQYGGQTVDRADELLAPYAMINYRKNMEKAELILPKNMDIDAAKNIVAAFKEKEPESLHMPDKTIEDKPLNGLDPDTIEGQRDLLTQIFTRKNIYDAMQTFFYQVETQYSSNGQTPFISMGFGLGTSWAEKEIQRAILYVSINGLGKDHRTAIFPKLLFTIKHGVNSEPDDPNYDIKRLALECTTKRMYPDVLFYENVIKISGSFKAPMGALAPFEMVTWKDAFGVHTTTFENMWSTLAARYDVKHQGTNGDDWFIDLPDGDVLIKDSHTGTVEFVGVRRIINNQPREWRRITFSDGRVVQCTDDHPWEVRGRGRTFTDDLNVGDVVDRSIELYDDDSNNRSRFSKDMAWLLGFIACDGCLQEPSEVIVSYNANNESEVRERIDSMFADGSLRHTHHERGRKGVYDEIAIKNKWLRSNCIGMFNGSQKTYRSVPSEIINGSREDKLSFLAGMIDADGYVNDSQYVQIGSVNKALAIGQMLLAESLGLHARIYVNHYNATYPQYVRYSVSFPATEEVINLLVCEKKRNHFKGGTKVQDIAISVVSVETIDSDDRSYDVTTTTDFFDVSGLVTHNCRSFLHGWVNPETGEDEESGRMNLGVVTVNLPYIALESKGDKKKFWKIFEQRMEVVHHGLQARIKRCCEAQVVNAPTLYQYGAFGRLNPGDNVSKLFKNKRSTISLGYTGVYEAVAVFYGKDWVNDFGWDEEAHEFAVSILSRMNDLCHQWEEEEDIHYSVYATPAESTTDRFSRALKDKFGIVEGVTDHDFVTNSFHRPVWLSGMPDHDPNESEQEVINRPSFHVSMDSGAMSKIDFEEPFLKYTPGGHIVYVEMPTMWQNLDAAEAIWDYEHDHGIDYSGLNSPIDHCEKCDFRGDCLPTEEGFKCPICGNMDPSSLQVVKRVCGYLGEPAARKPVKGRLEEIAHRKLHSQGEIGRVRNQDGDEEAIYGDYALPRTSKLIK